MTETDCIMEQRLTIDYQEFDSPEQLSAEDQKVIAAALEAKKGSYSPYSHFQVGAALLLEDGTALAARGT